MRKTKSLINPENYAGSEKYLLLFIFKYSTTLENATGVRNVILRI